MHYCSSYIEQISKGILSSVGGYDLLLPQHLKDLILKASGDSGVQLLTAITRLGNKMLKVEKPNEILSIFLGASLIAFFNPNEGVRPILIGNALHRLTAKVAAYSVQAKIESKRFPYQHSIAILVIQKQ